MTTARLALIAAGVILFVIFILPVFIMRVWNTGSYIGLLMAALFIGYGIFFGKINSLVYTVFKNAAGKVFLIIVSLLVAALFVFAAVVTVNIVYRANRSAKEDTTVIVLGCRVRADGASTMLKTRLNAALQYLTDNPEAKCILSGGQGKDEPVAEADYMYGWLVENGIDSSRLFTENRSTSTEENLLFSKKIIEENNLSDSITIITNEFHQYRAYRFAMETGYTSCYGYSASTPLYALPTYYIREICGVAHMIFIK